MNAYYEDEIAEIAEVDEFDEFDERARRGIRRRFPSLPVPRPGNILSAAPSARPVTRTEFTNATRKLDEKISVNSRAIKTVEGRVNAVAEANTRQNKAISTLQTDVKSVREISMLLPLLSSQKTAVLSDGTEVVVPSDDTFSKMLPLLLLSGGLGGTGGASGGDANSGLGGMMLPLVLILASQK